MISLQDKFRGCLLGSVVGDVVGAVVEAESPGYIAQTYRNIDEILAVDSVAEFAGPAWRVGRFTDDTQMTLCVAEWLLEDESHSPENLLARFAKAYEPWRRYGPGTAGILRLFEEHRNHWRQLSTAMFPQGSYGNGSAMRVAPIALAYFRDLKKAMEVAVESSRPTHSHSLADQAVVLQCVAVATAVGMDKFSPQPFLQTMRASLTRFSDLLQDTSILSHSIDAVGGGLEDGTSCEEMSLTLGTGVDAHEAVPMAIYCFLSHPESYAKVIHEAVFLGGDTDTIACMAGAISGAFLGVSAIPSRWCDAIREDEYSGRTIETLADRLFAKYV